MKNNRYIVVTWPDTQMLFEIPGFRDNSYLINDNKGMYDFGSSAYFVNENWLNIMSELLEELHEDERIREEDIRKEESLG